MGLRASTTSVRAQLASVGLSIMVLSWTQGGRLPAQQPDSAGSQDLADAQAFVKRNCARCHNDRRKRGGLVLADLDLSRVGAHADVWEKVVVKMRAGLMPPSGARRPDPVSYDGFRTWLANELDGAAAEHPNPGPNPVFHRLNRTEYQSGL